MADKQITDMYPDWSLPEYPTGGMPSTAYKEYARMEAAKYIREQHPQGNMSDEDYDSYVNAQAKICVNTKFALQEGTITITTSTPNGELAGAYEEATSSTEAASIWDKLKASYETIKELASNAVDRIKEIYNERLSDLVKEGLDTEEPSSDDQLELT